MNIFYIISYFFQISYLHKLVDSVYLWLLPALLLLSYIVVNLIKNKKLYLTIFKNKTPFLLLVFCLILGLTRSNNPEEKELSSYIKIVQLLLLLFSTGIFIMNSKKNINKIFSSIIAPFSLFCLLNLILWTINYKVNDTEEINIGQAIMLSNFGFTIDRVSFPLGFGVNNYGTLIGAILILSITSFIFIKNNKSIYIFTIAICIITLLLLDSRASLLNAILIVLLCLYIYNKNAINLVKYIPYIAVFGPIFYMVTIPLLSQNEIISGLTRNSQELVTGNSRFFIWGIALNELSNFQIEHIFGFGEYGHYKSGASLIWSSFFGDYEKNDLKSPHNTVLSIVFDYGYIGLAIYIYILIDISKKIRSLWPINKNISIIFTSFYFYLVLIGITEATFGLYILQFNYLFYTFTLSLYTIHETLIREIKWKKNVTMYMEKEIV
ncbi:O-antigen ligase [Larkinella sp. C7]|uniref:O-antigen ligase family protein n=1 Tax=Larkinella sp. C7 TaxID=2576607 RepID=UPI00111103F5|nr:O-antigen ligase family protein [Larkinella sp. C7]